VDDAVALRRTEGDQPCGLQPEQRDDPAMTHAPRPLGQQLTLRQRGKHRACEAMRHRLARPASVFVRRPRRSTSGRVLCQSVHLAPPGYPAYKVDIGAQGHHL
jgi:hypothetical protein